jgi:hypothetical protein
MCRRFHPAEFGRICKELHITNKDPGCFGDKAKAGGSVAIGSFVLAPSERARIWGDRNVVLQVFKPQATGGFGDSWEKEYPCHLLLHADCCTGDELRRTLAVRKGSFPAATSDDRPGNPAT